ncbi:hypothetical protein CPB83DRAFT_283981 [Crepidotus variabilis]|uniref:Gylcosyl hydrolase 115 C-terminal domain-containing protein n=1 Tax=Crepidotus variabilis TaxID=179855 RepID=A0A9P6EHP0_9AGAR|nr:hypothetical protein CPB83DRAFT_283981 [Crepidotus variabilis]
MRRMVFFLIATTLGLLTKVYGLGQTSCVSFTSLSKSFTVVENGKASPIFISVDEWPGVQLAAKDFAADINRVTSVKPSLTNYTAAGGSPPSSSASTHSSSLSSPIPSSTPASSSLSSSASSILPREPQISSPATSDTSGALKPSGSSVIIVGTFNKSSLITEVIKNTKLDVSSIQGQWEAYLGRTVKNPLPGVSEAYVIIGSDKRGTIYGLYDLSEQFGVSPWYYWADVVTTTQKSLYITSPGCSHGTPTVKYRGIFLNDEQPSLENWARETFTNGTGKPFNHLFYSKLYELILRLRGNYLWPAMWGAAFGSDDPLNQPLADYYGVVMGTSHQEPMMLSTPNEFNIFGKGAWDYSTNTENINAFWLQGAQRAKNYESVYTMGMRGFGDLPLSEDTNIDLLEGVIVNQTKIFKQVYGEDIDPATIPQIWTLYKEVEKYYADGMRVPEYITLLWADDNWGNIRRFPYIEERNRTGGAGVYYHFDYVGDPRDYKWITTNQLAKVQQQLSLALSRNASRLWIVNVGDLKPYEREIEFFLGFGYNNTRWAAPSGVSTYVNQWATREFDLSKDKAAKVEEIVGNLTRFNARRKHELINATTYSLYNYREAETVLTDWTALEAASTSVYNSLPPAMRPSFFQLVHHPIIASANLARIYIYAGQNNMRASQARLSTNQLADQVEEYFEKDFDIEQQYHNLLDGKWDHIMDQTHLGYYYWQQPMTNTMPAVNRVQSRKKALAGVMRIVPEGTPGAWPGDNPFQCDAGYNCGQPTVVLDNFSPIKDRYLDVGAGGPTPFTFTVSTNSTWLKLSTTKGSISPDQPEQRVYGTVSDWNSLPIGTSIALVTLTAKASGERDLAVNTYFKAIKNEPPNGFKGFVEGTGVISIEAAHTTKSNNKVQGVTWTELPGLGRTVSAVTPLPLGDQSFAVGTGPTLEYDFYNFNTLQGKGNVSVIVYMTSAFNFDNDNHPLAYSVQVDSLPAVKVVPIPPEIPGAYPANWVGVDGYVANNIIKNSTIFNGITPGAHTLKIGMIEPGVAIQKIVIDTGGLVSSYLGPPESIRI